MNYGKSWRKSKRLGPAKHDTRRTKPKYWYWIFFPPFGHFFGSSFLLHPKLLWLCSGVQQRGGDLGCWDFSKFCNDNFQILEISWNFCYQHVTNIFKSLLEFLGNIFFKSEGFYNGWNVLLTLYFTRLASIERNLKFELQLSNKSKLKFFL